MSKSKHYIAHLHELNRRDREAYERCTISSVMAWLERQMMAREAEIKEATDE